ncbi:helix-turn-helix transcriptional regulator [Alteraurantiacibacter aquimixticola]|uniref:DNA-binding protein n=1 Tax=Alteraurantiacibacter aquimixticola TaxID=2489173 RepID=A0A4T3EWC1_9SPHN|nr:helix-turn-helix domain-containing protein [Alteraurantiacibacter aquimixticola]TIX48845.1 DNA-binding protein [Alteraurantiacibacter aquimixticola]
MLLNTRDAADYLGLSSSTLEHWRTTEPMRGPAFVRLGHQVRYRQSDLDEYVNSSVVEAA